VRIILQLSKSVLLLSIPKQGKARHHFALSKALRVDQLTEQKNIANITIWGHLLLYEPIICARILGSEYTNHTSKSLPILRNFGQILANMRVITESDSAQGAENSFLGTPSKLMAGTWTCESPKMFAEPPQKAATTEGLTITSALASPESRESAPEQRDAAQEEHPRGGDQTDDQAPEQRTESACTTPMPPSTPSEKFECDYDTNPTDTFLDLQRKEWASAAKRAVDSPVEARTWVSRKEKHGKLRWRLLPLHAAIIFKAPDNVVESLLAAYPKGGDNR
jgi:hypothetical protein